MFMWYVSRCTYRFGGLPASSINSIAWQQYHSIWWVWPEMHAPMLCNDAMVSWLLMPLCPLGKVSSLVLLSEHMYRLCMSSIGNKIATARHFQHLKFCIMGLRLERCDNKCPHMQLCMCPLQGIWASIAPWQSVQELAVVLQQKQQLGLPSSLCCRHCSHIG